MISTSSAAGLVSSPSSWLLEALLVFVIKSSGLALELLFWRPVSKVLYVVYLIWVFTSVHRPNSFFVLSLRLLAMNLIDATIFSRKICNTE